VRVLVACEYSGIVRDAFLARGHDAWSCDLLPTERPGPHYQRDVREVLMAKQSWDLMVAHPPCTFLSNSGVKWLYTGGKATNGIDHTRWELMKEAAEFFHYLWIQPIPKICIENPIMHGYGKTLIGVGQSQVFQPWQFGHGEVKATCLWLKGLPPLTPTNIVGGRTPRVHYASPGPDRWKERSRTLRGPADAMASQWG
jgi:hypothetical protein